MNKNETYQPSADALARYFSRESPADEIRQIDAWRIRDQDAQDEFERLALIWKDLGTVKIESPNVDSKAAFNKVKAKKDRAVSRKFFAIVWRSAAVLMILGSIMFYLTRDAKSLNQEILAQKVEKIELPDGSDVTLNKGAKITFSENFEGNTRNVVLSGEAFFSIMPDKSKPFSVEVEDVVVTVLGTKFNIRQDTQQIEVTVAEGRVSVTSPTEQIILTDGEQATINLPGGQVTKQLIDPSGTEIFWFTGKLNYAGTTLDQVISDLEKVYKVNIEVSGDEILNCKLRAQFENQTIEEVLEIVALTQNLTLSKNGKTYTLSGEGCSE